MTDSIELPSLDDLPTQPPPPPPSARDSRKRPLASRDSNSVRRPLGTLMAALLFMHLSLTASTFAVVVMDPPLLVALGAITLGNGIWSWCFVTILGILGRGR